MLLAIRDIGHLAHIVEFNLCKSMTAISPTGIKSQVYCDLGLRENNRSVSRDKFIHAKRKDGDLLLLEAIYVFL